MLQHVQSNHYANTTFKAVSDRPERATIDAGEALGILRRHLGLITLLSLLALAAAWFYSSVAASRYVATAQIFIDPRELQVYEREVSPRALSTDSGITVVESQARVLGSDNVLQKAIAAIGLDKDPEFSGYREPLPNTVLGKLKGILRGPDQSPGDTSLNALRGLKKNIVIKRGERSFVVDLSVYADDAGKAAKIANAISAAYLEEQASARSDAVRQAGGSIEGRLGELKRRVSEDEARITKYRNENNLVVASGRFVNEQQLTDLSNQLNAAQAETARARSRFEEIEASKGAPENLPEAVRSETLRVLRAQAANVSRERARLATQFKPAHPRMADILNQEAQSQKGILEEIKRITEAAKLDYRRAQAGEESLRTSVEKARKQMNETSGAMVQMRELERNLEASRVVYQASIVRVREAKEQEQLNTTNARVISVATPAPDKLWPPRKVLLMPIALLGGLGLGSALAFVLEAARRRRQSAGASSGSSNQQSYDAQAYDANVAAIDAAPAPRAITQDPAARAASAAHSPRRLRSPAETMAFADIRGVTRLHGDSLAPASFAMSILADPSSAASRQFNQLYLTLRRLERNGRPRSVLIVPDRQTPMKSEVALALAVAGGMTGDRILLIDADTQNRTLTDTLCQDNIYGLTDVLAGRATLTEAVIPYPETGIEVLAVSANQKTELGRRADPSAFVRLLDSASHYDLVIIDGAPLGHRLSSLATATAVSDILFVVGGNPKAGNETSDVLASTMRSTPKFRGIVLTD
jgi:polysaccharide biosynthesis transport protein